MAIAHLVDTRYNKAMNPDVVKQAITNKLHLHLLRRNALLLLMCFCIPMAAFLLRGFLPEDDYVDRIIGGVTLMGFMAFGLMSNPSDIRIERTPLHQRTFNIIGFLCVLVPVVSWYTDMVPLEQMWLLGAFPLILFRCIDLHWKLYSLLKTDAPHIDWHRAMTGEYAMRHELSGRSAASWLKEYEQSSTTYQNFIPRVVVAERLEALFERETHYDFGEDYPLGVLRLMDEKTFDGLCQRYEPLKHNESWKMARSIINDSREAYLQWMKTNKSSMPVVEAPLKDFSLL